MSKYASLDAAILESLAEKPKLFMPLFVGNVRLQCNAEAGVHLAFRALDRRLQALRKAGKLHYTSAGWMLGAKP